MGSNPAGPAKEFLQKENVATLACPGGVSVTKTAGYESSMGRHKFKGDCYESNYAKKSF